MKIEKEITVTLTVDELDEIIKSHLRTQDISVEDINYSITEEWQEGDWKAEYPPTPKLNEIICTVKQ